MSLLLILQFSIILLSSFIVFIESFIIVNNQHIYYWFISVPFPKYFNYYIIICLWSLFVVIHGISFCLIPKPINNNSSIDIYFSSLILNTFSYILNFFWPIFLYFYHNYNLSLLTILNSLIFYILYFFSIILYFITSFDINITLFIPTLIIFFILCFFYIYLLISHLHLISNISSEEL
jgi:hypothetical protein